MPANFVVSALLALLCFATLEAVAGDNVIVGGTFDEDSGVNDPWNSLYLAVSGPIDGFAVLDTQPYFWAGNVGGIALFQFYDLTTEELQALASDGLDYTLSGDLFSLGDSPDSGVFSAEFYEFPGGGGQRLGGPVEIRSADNDPGSWPLILTAGEAPNYQQVEGTVPPGTQSVYFQYLGFDDDFDSRVDTHVDNLSFNFGFRAEDADSDDIIDTLDNCIEVANPFQVDTNGDGIGNVCDADIAGPGGTNDDDCLVNFNDLNSLKQAFFTTTGDPDFNPNADFTGASDTPDNTVNFLDLQRMKDYFFSEPGPSATGCN